MPHINELYDFTVSFLVLHPSERKILLHFHQKLHCWNQLGGHIELNEQPIEAVMRELEEEAGLKPNDYEIIQTNPRLEPRGVVSLPLGFGLFIYDYLQTGHKHIDIPYVIRSKTTRISPATGESKQIDWFSREQITKMHEEGILEDVMLDICNWIFETQF